MLSQGGLRDATINIDTYSDITNYVIVDFKMAIAILETLKISDWLSDGLDYCN